VCKDESRSPAEGEPRKLTFSQKKTNICLEKGDSRSKREKGQKARGYSKPTLKNREKIREKEREKSLGGEDLHTIMDARGGGLP